MTADDAQTVLDEKLAAQYAALAGCVDIAAAGCVDIAERSKIEVTGSDRVRFLHGFCTNDIQKLSPGEGCEAMLLDVKGRIVGYVFVVCREDAIWLETAAGQAKPIIEHLDRYVITDDVEFRDLADSHGGFLLAGQNANSVFEAIFGEAPPSECLGSRRFSGEGVEGVVVRTPLAGSVCHQLIFPSEQADTLLAMLEREGVMACGGEVLEALRIENGIPEYGRDVSRDNLPQELGRDEAAISFTKGCYLGQETVARIDALGHVNRKLVGLRLTAPHSRWAETAQLVGTALLAGDDGKDVGAVTSAAYSPGQKCSVALALVRAEHVQPGERFTIDDGAAEVVALPMA